MKYEWTIQRGFVSKVEAPPVPIKAKLIRQSIRGVKEELRKMHSEDDIVKLMNIEHDLFQLLQNTNP